LSSPTTRRARGRVNHAAVPAQHDRSTTAARPPTDSTLLQQHRTAPVSTWHRRRPLPHNQALQIDHRTNRDRSSSRTRTIPPALGYRRYVGGPTRGRPAHNHAAPPRGTPIGIAGVLTDGIGWVLAVADGDRAAVSPRCPRDMGNYPCIGCSRLPALAGSGAGRQQHNMSEVRWRDDGTGTLGQAVRTKAVRTDNGHRGIHSNGVCLVVGLSEISGSWAVCPGHNVATVESRPVKWIPRNGQMRQAGSRTRRSPW
jgi:hypothetical protein